MRILSVVVVATLLTACGGSSPAPTTEEVPAAAEGTVPAAEGTAAAEGAAPAADAAATAAGTAAADGLTKEKLVAANGAVMALNPWADSLKKLTDMLGAPQKQTGPDYVWWAKDGENCQVLRVQQSGDMVGQVTLTSEPCPQ